MSDASNRLEARAGPTHERLDPWIAAFVSALLHLLALLALLYASTPTVTTPQGAASGGRVEVDFVGETRQPATQGPPSPPPARTLRPVPAPPAASHVRSTLVERTDDPVPPNAPTASDGPTPALQPMERPGVSPPQPSEATDAATQRQARAPAANPPASTRRRPRVWGQPPGMIEEDADPVNAGPSRSPAPGRGRGDEASSADASLEAGDYQVHYQLVSEARLRTWRDAGMTELF
ncbi:MAG TPA: type II toxin-antitoxin system RelE/ParE family toxin, partial [Pseudoxanthomonas sp.]|nr:type II toxin-antitoxin system RelE/ParE family toxin [Pseudoxanthomonas sp.]